MKTIELENINVLELTGEEQRKFEGGILPIVLTAFTIVGAIYGAGHVLGEAYYHYTHNK